MKRWTGVSGGCQWILLKIIEHRERISSQQERLATEATRLDDEALDCKSLAQSTV